MLLPLPLHTWYQAHQLFTVISPGSCDLGTHPTVTSPSAPHRECCHSLAFTSLHPPLKLLQELLSCCCSCTQGDFNGKIQWKQKATALFLMKREKTSALLPGLLLLRAQSLIPPITRLPMFDVCSEQFCKAPAWLPWLQPSRVPRTL